MMNPTSKKIKILLVEHEISGAKIARSMNVARSAIYHVISGKSKSVRLRQAVANAVGKTIEELWPNDKREIDEI